VRLTSDVLRWQARLKRTVACSQYRSGDEKSECEYDREYRSEKCLQLATPRSVAINKDRSKGNRRDRKQESGTNEQARVRQGPNGEDT